MKNQISAFLLMFWTLGAITTGSFFSTKANPEEKNIVKTERINSNAQFSTTTSFDDLNVYGSATLTEDSPSGLSYRITMTITSPLGRTNTTQSDWNLAPVTHTAGLSIGDEDGAYNVQTTVESQSGSYDDYDNFTGSGGANVIGTKTDVAEVPPLITLTNLIFTNPTIPAIAGRTSSAVATVTYSNGVPENTTVDMEINDSPIGVGNPLYSINTPTFDPIDAGVPTGTRNRTVRLKVPAATNNPRSARVTFPFVLSQNTGSGTVNANVRIGNIITPSPVPSPVPTVNPPLGLNAVLTISPTPSPTPGGVGGTVCRPECFEPNQGCPCSDSGGIYGNSRPESCTSLPKFVKTGFAPKKSALPLCWCSSSPILIDVAGNGFSLTNAANGVSFDFNGDGTIGGKLAWTTGDSDDAWLVLDRNENNRIDNGKELFGNATDQPAPPEGEERQGFLALAEFDKPAKGGNNDGKITRRDTVFRQLRLWQDKNHNGISEAEELSRLPALDVVAVFLDYHQSKRTDRHGNQFKYRAKVRDARGARVGRWAWDVFLEATR